ncbi:MAG: PIN domain-containing protein [Cyanobacteria bacterium P01_F01_bin.150]
MTSLAPMKLILDISTLSATTTREWLGFSRAGDCHIPHMVYEEIRFLYERSPDPDLERVSREFNRFYATSGWKISEVTGHHPLLKSATGRALTKRARVALAVARCAYGEAQKNSRQLVVLVTSDRAILQRIYDIQLPNLAGIPSSALLSWSRSGKRPVAVTQKLQELKELGYSQGGGTIRSHSSTTPARKTSQTRSKAQHSTRRRDTASARTVAYSQSYSTRLRPSRTQIPGHTQTRLPHTSRSQTRSYQRGRRTQVSKYVPAVPPWFPQFMSMLSALAALAFAGLILWVMFFTPYFERFLPRDEPSPVSQINLNI